MLKTGFLTLITLGFYRFWTKTRLRRYYWSAVRIGGVPLEYIGDPLEKLLGFLIAVVVLAFYLGVVNLILMFASFSLFHDDRAAYVAAAVLFVPLIFFAQYRARRYVLSRTRWRGIRFGVESGAWGYALRASLWWLATVLSLGLAWPLKDFMLEKYRTDRTHFGTAPLAQGGRAGMLYGAFGWFMLGGILIALGLLPLVLRGLAAISLDRRTYASASNADALGVLLLIGVPVVLYGFAHYKAHAFKALTEAKICGALRFAADPRPWKLVGIYVGGWLLLALGMVVLGFALFFAVGLLSAILLFGSAAAMDLSGAGAFDAPIALQLIVGVTLYFGMFMTFDALRHALITLPVARHFATTMSITGEGLDDIAQRARDEMSQAEGFAEALDLGAAI